jgi:rhodanese-related sulfurtransferase
LNAIQFRSIDRSALERALEEVGLDNEDPSEGIALVNVLEPDLYVAEHIPGSINVPLGHEDEFEQRYARGKTIVVYGASRRCGASPEAARELARRGFANVLEYAGGLNDWKQAGGPVQSAPN